ncbi:MAG: CvpA family protein [Gemmataceae bacterium]|nr:CvpA family protein [Gemmataceae bacterium]
MFIFSTIVIMLAVGYAFWREGLITAIGNFVLLMISFAMVGCFMDPVASFLGGYFNGHLVSGFEDATAMAGIFALSYTLLRLAANQISPTMLDLPLLAHQAGALALGFLVGFLVSGFLWCLMQTLPWTTNFWGFRPRSETGPISGFAAFRPDRVWLATMAFLSKGSLSNGNPFDPSGSFEIRYERYRRFEKEGGSPKVFEEGDLDFNQSNKP